MLDAKEIIWDEKRWKEKLNLKSVPRKEDAKKELEKSKSENGNDWKLAVSSCRMYLWTIYDPNENKQNCKKGKKGKKNELFSFSFCVISFFFLFSWFARYDSVSWVRLLHNSGFYELFRGHYKGRTTEPSCMTSSSTTSSLWSKITENPDVSTEPLTRPFTHSLAPLTCLLAPPWLLRLRAPLRCTHLLPSLWESESLNGCFCCAFFCSGP